jgi:hypothetical protein
MDLFDLISQIFCGSGQCAEVNETAEGFTLTSTIDGNDGSVTYTPAEFAHFLRMVKAGDADALLAKAEARAGLTTTA